MQVGEFSGYDLVATNARIKQNNKCKIRAFVAKFYIS